MWRLPAHEPDEVICHNDFAPYNFVFREHILHAVIDFDTASPGPRVWDIAYLAYRLVPLTAASNPDAPRSSTQTRARRLTRLCEEYGRDLVTPAAVLATAPGRLEELAALATAGLRTPPDHARLYRADAAYIRSAAELLAT
jgi:Ser/Thr protein kinase RdoA (MazF antagonist)